MIGLYSMVVRISRLQRKGGIRDSLLLRKYGMQISTSQLLNWGGTKSVCIKSSSSIQNPLPDTKSRHTIEARVVIVRKARPPSPLWQLLSSLQRRGPNPASQETNHFPAAFPSCAKLPAEQGRVRSWCCGLVQLVFLC